MMKMYSLKINIFGNRQRACLLIFLGVFHFSTLLAQTDLKVGTSPGSLSTSAVFEAASTTKGALIPRMTTAQMNAISSPALGLLVFNTDANCLYFYVSGWKSQCDPANLGAWSLLGNAGISSSNFLGSTNNASLRFRTNNIERMIVDSTGNVGIGTSSPLTPLHLYTDVSNNAFRISNGTNTGRTMSAFVENNGYSEINTTGSDLGIKAGYRLNLIGQGGAWGNVFSFAQTTATTHNNGTSFLRFDGNYAPSTAPTTAGDYRFFDINPIINQTGTANLDYSILDMNVTETSALGANKYLAHWRTNGLSRFSVTSAGFVGIGTAAPKSQLDVYATSGGETRLSSNSALKYGEIIFSSNNSGYLDRGASIEGNGNNVGLDVGQLIFKTQYGSSPRTERMRINYNGLVGINTATPSYKLDIDANTGSTGNPLRLQGLQAGATSDSLLTSASGVVKRLAINQLGTGNFWKIGGNTEGGVRNLGTTDNFALPFLTNNVERMRITETGSIGIGTTSPVARLHATGVSGLDAAYFITNGNSNALLIDHIGNAAVGNGIKVNSQWADNNGAIYINHTTTATSGSGTYAKGMKISGNYLHTGSTVSHNGEGLNIDVTNNAATTGILYGERITATSNSTGSTVLGLGVTVSSSSGTAYAATFNGGNVGIGISTPQYRLDIDAKTGSTGNPLRLQGLQAGATSDSLLTSASGVVRRLAINQLGTGNFWKIGGNTEGGVRNLGTTDNYALPFMTNNIERMRITETGNIGIGKTAPAYKVDVSGWVSADFLKGVLSVTDNRAVIDTPNNMYMGLSLNFKNNSAIALTSQGVYSGVQTFRPYASGTLNGGDWTGGAAHQTAYTQNGHLLHRTGTINSWTNWRRIIEEDTLGNVGIGTTSPNAKLNIIGGDLTIGNNAAMTAFPDSSRKINIASDNGNNTDPISIYTYYPSSDVTHLRLSIGDNAANTTNDLFQVGATASNSWYPWLSVRGNGVGIGTTAPSYKLDIDANTGGTGNPLRLQGLQAGATSDSLVTSQSGVLKRLAINQLGTGNFWKIGGNTEGVLKNFGTTDNYALPFLTNNVERMRITEAGNVGIGTSSPNAKLEIIGGINVSPANSTQSNGVGYLTSSDFFDYTNVLGTFKVNNYGMTFGPYPSSAATYISGYGELALMTTSKNRLHITSTGNIGINTNNPQYKLDINADSASTGNPLRLKGLQAGATSDSLVTSQSGVLKRLAINQLGTGNFWKIGGNTEGVLKNFGTTDNYALPFLTNNVERMRITEAGSVGIGTSSPGLLLHIAASSGSQQGIYLSDGSNTDLRIYRDTDVGNWSLLRSDIGNGIGIIGLPDIMSISVPRNTGNVGISTTTPQAKLDVNGKMISGSAVATGGSVIVEGLYNQSTGAGALNILGASYSSGGTVLSYGGVPSSLLRDSFTSSTNVALPRAAMILDGDINFLNATSQTLAIGTPISISSKMIIKTSGRVGIGTNAPSRKLELSVGDQDGIKVVSTGSARMDFTTAGGGGVIYSNNIGHYFQDDIGTNRVAILATGNTGIGVTNPSVKLDVDGAVAVRANAVSVTADNQAVTVGNRSYLKLTADGAPTNRTVSLSNGASEGQILIISIIGTGANGIELADSGNLNLSGTAQLDNGDTIQLIWDGTSWNEITRSYN